MYTGLTVRNFRCFRELHLARLARVNLFVGANNVGKTALLESLFLHCGAYNPRLTLTLGALRGIQSVKVEQGMWKGTPWDSLFNEYDSSRTIEVAGNETRTGERILELRILRSAAELDEATAHTGATTTPPPDGEPNGVASSQQTSKVLRLVCQEAGKRERYYLFADSNGIRAEPVSPSPPFQTFFHGARTRVAFEEEAERFGDLQIHGREGIVAESLRILEPRLRSVTMTVVAGQPILHGDIGLSRLIPLPLMGEGVVRLASMVNMIGNATNGVVLVDEIENGLYYKTLGSIWLEIGRLARRFDTQVFATTHSAECVFAAHRAFSQSGNYDLAVSRLERSGEEIRVVPYDEDTLRAAAEVGMEVR